LRLGDDGADMLAGVVDRLAEQLRPPAREVVVGRAAGRAAVLENVRDRGGMCTPLPDQQRSRDDHPLAWASHRGSSDRLMYDVIHTRRARESLVEQISSVTALSGDYSGPSAVMTASRWIRRSWCNCRRWSSSR